MAIIRPKHYYFVGIGGISMSGIASLLAERGYRVSGSDISDSEIIQKLKTRGISVNIDQKADNIVTEIDFVVYSAAISYSNPELKQARKLKIQSIKRSELIGDLMRNKYGIAVAGMHGKTTITSMLTLIFEKCGLDPTALIGTELKEIGGNFRIGKSQYFIAEACEYYNAFLDFQPRVGIISNIEAEHLDFFGNLKGVLKSFTKFVKGLSNDGLLIVCKDNENVRKIITDAECPVITYGFDEAADVVAYNVIDKAGYIQFDIRHNNKIIKGFELRIPGIHNVLNATSCIALSIKMGIEPKIIKDVLRNFRGSARRFEVIDKIAGITLVSDYAHHPTEIKTTLLGAKKFYPKSRIICIFQPHQYKRTKSLLKDFGKVFNNANLTIIPNIYEVSGRDTEKDKKSVSAEKLVSEIKKNKGKAKFVDGFLETITYVIHMARAGDILIIMGAGDVYKIVKPIVERLKNKIKYDQLIKKTGKIIKKNVKLASYTTFKIGGSTDLFLETNKIDVIKKVGGLAAKLKIPIFILGSGSNILVSDNGFRGLAIRNNCQKIEIKNNIILVESGALLSEVASKSVKKSLSGLEFAVGIPGTIGGAVVGNAGLPKESISNVLTRALILDEEGELQTVNNSYFNFKYRRSKFKKKNNKEIILKVELQLKWDEPELIKQKMNNLFSERRKKQPLGFPSAGSIFKNPSPKYPAGLLIEKTGLKNKRAGEVYVSPKHANFIITKHGATAKDVSDLINKIKRKVLEKNNIALEEEIQYIGEWEK
jgi:UDP-N-acetylmuramate--alanine ligase